MKSISRKQYGVLWMLRMLLIFALFFGHVPVAQAAGITPRIHPILQRMAAETPNESVRVIVQQLSADGGSSSLVWKYGGEVVRELDLINAYVAELPAHRVPLLGRSADVRWISPDADVVEAGRSTAQTLHVRDEFAAVTFTGSDGTAPWLASWAEIGEEDGPEVGEVKVARFLGGTEQGLRIQGTSRGAERAFDLSQASEPTLTFTYRRKGFRDEDYVTVSASPDGDNWVEVGRLQGPATDESMQSATFDLSGAVSDRTSIRLLSALQEDARLYVDDVDVSYVSSMRTSSAQAPAIYLPLQAVSGVTNPQTEPVDLVSAANGSLTVLDTFSSGTYGGNHGTTSWATSWSENDDSGGGASGGEIYVQSGSTNCPTGAGCLIFDPDRENDYIVRSVDLSGASSATLSYDYNATQFDTSGLAEFEVQVKGASGVWQNLVVFRSQSNERTINPIVGSCSGDPVGSCTHDISPYLNTDPAQPVQVRIFVAEDNSNEPIGWDNFAIEYGTSGSSSTAAPVSSATLLDAFSSGTYGGNHGTTSWATAWSENDDTGGGASGGEIYVQSGSTHCPTGAGCLVFDPDEEGDYVVRSADLSSATSATLSYDYNATQFNTSGLAEFEVQMKDAAGVWQDLVVFRSQSNVRTINAIVGSCSGDPVGSCTHDISPYLNTDPAQPAQIRILVTEDNSNEPIGWDNFAIEYSTLSNTFVKSIGAEELWYESTPVDGQQITIAVVDSGIVEHDDFFDDDDDCRVLEHVNFNNSGSIDDFYGHGTHVAGAIAGNGFKSNGARAGVAPRANLIDVKVTDDYGAGSTSDVIAGLQWIYNNKEAYNIRVVNVSLNSSVAQSYHLSPLNAALEILWFNGIVVVVSAGNNGMTNSGVLYPPANDPFFLAVGAVDDGDTPSLNDNVVAPFSAYGTTLAGFAKPDLVAPGVDIIAALASDDSNLALDHPAHAVPGATGNHYFRMSGTSMASAVVAGAVALLLQDEPSLTPDQVKYRLMDTAATNWPGYSSVKAGAGILDIKAAVKGTSTASANTGVQASQLLWTGSDPVNWGSVNWGSVNWGSVNWGSVSWGSVNWGSVSWGSVNWDD